MCENVLPTKQMIVSFLYTNHNNIRLQRVQNNLARVVLCNNRRTSADPPIHDLHWIGINERIQYKLYYF